MPRVMHLENLEGTQALSVQGNQDGTITITIRVRRRWRGWRRYRVILDAGESQTLRDIINRYVWATPQGPEPRSWQENRKERQCPRRKPGNLENVRNPDKSKMTKVKRVLPGEKTPRQGPEQPKNGTNILLRAKK